MVFRRARRLVRKWPVMRYAEDELVSLGNAALAECGRVFRPEVQHDFERFASKRVGGAMLRFILDTVYGPGGRAPEARPTVRAIHEADARDWDEPEPEEAWPSGTNADDGEQDAVSATVQRLRRKVAAHAMVVYDTLEKERVGEDAVIAELDLRRTHGAIRAALARLSDRQREVLRERIVEKMTLQEVATSRGGVSVKTVQRDLDVALSALDGALTAAKIDASFIGP